MQNESETRKLSAVPEPIHGAPVTQPIKRFGRYEVIARLASGGMGIVYLARLAGAAGFSRLFAVKVIHDHLAERATFVDMLLDEARLAAQVHHPNVVGTVDLGLQDGRNYLVQDYVEGPTLTQLLRRNREKRDPRLIVPILLDVLAGLSGAHAATEEGGDPLHLVHRDISAQNILVGVEGIARIADFGIAQAESRLAETRPGETKGKYAYMAPEQFSGRDLDQRVDVYAAGIVLYNALTGTRLFCGNSDSETVSNVLNEKVPPPSGVGLKPPSCFDDICLKAIAREREERYPTAAAMAEALRQVALDHDLLGAPSDVAAWVQSSFGDKLAERREVLKRFSKTGVARVFEETCSYPSLSSTSGLRAARGSSGPPESMRSRVSYPMFPQSRIPEPVSIFPQRQTRRSSAWRIAAIALVLSAVGIGVLLAPWSKDVAPSSPRLSAPATSDQTDTHPALPAKEHEPTPRIKAEGHDNEREVEPTDESSEAGVLATTDEVNTPDLVDTEVLDTAPKDEHALTAEEISHARPTGESSRRESSRRESSRRESARRESSRRERSRHSRARRENNDAQDRSARREREPESAANERVESTRVAPQRQPAPSPDSLENNPYTIRQ